MRERGKQRKKNTARNRAQIAKGRALGGQATKRRDGETAILKDFFSKELHLLVSVKNSVFGPPTINTVPSYLDFFL